MFNNQIQIGIVADRFANHMPVMLATLELQSLHFKDIPLKKQDFSNESIARFVRRLHSLKTSKIFQCSDVNFA